MRFASAIVITLLIHLGLFARVTGEGLCCPEPASEHAHVHDHDAGGAGHHHDDCHDDRDHSPHGDDCPSDCGEHHHHHGTCFHSVQMSLLGDGHCRIAAPHAVSQGCDWSHMRAPDGPVFEMDKPPLIRASA